MPDLGTHRVAMTVPGATESPVGRGNEAAVEWGTWFISDAVIFRTVADLG